MKVSNRKNLIYENLNILIPPFPSIVKYEEKELLQGMRNCYDVCGEDYDRTVEMVSSARDRDPSEVEKTLVSLRKKYGHTKEYQKIRNQIPEDFPF
jgi:hypothetical protein